VYVPADGRTAYGHLSSGVNSREMMIGEHVLPGLATNDPICVTSKHNSGRLVSMYPSLKLLPIKSSTLFYSSEDFVEPQAV